MWILILKNQVLFLYFQLIVIFVDTPYCKIEVAYCTTFLYLNLEELSRQQRNLKRNVINSPAIMYKRFNGI
jgi:hypothetical protein